MGYIRQWGLFFQLNEFPGGAVLINQQIPRRPIQQGSRILHFAEIV